MILSKVKNYALLAFSLFILILAFENYIQKGKLLKSREDNARLEANNFQLMADNRQQTTLYLTAKERTVKLNRTVDSLAKALKIKPKQVDKIIYIENITHDTVKISVPVDLISQDYWYIQDSSKCFKWAANAYLWGKDLKVERVLYENKNVTTQVFYRKRPNKFLFIKFGRWINIENINSNCGETTIKTFKFVK